MAAFAGTAADIRPLPPVAQMRRFNAGGALTVGQAVYLASDGDVEAADADGQATAQAVGIVVAVGAAGATTAAAGDRVDVCVFGPVTGYSSLTPGGVAYVSPTAGSMDQTASATSGDYNFIIGYAESATTVFVSPQLAVPTAVP